MTTAGRFQVAAFLVVLSLGSSAAGAAGADHPVQEGIVLAESQLALEDGIDRSSFNFSHLRDLWLRVRLKGFAGPAHLSLRLIDPQGVPIYEASVPYASDPKMTTIDVQGTGHPVAVFQTKTLRGGVGLDYAIPVSGSVVTRNLSEGTWTLLAEVGGRTFSTSIDVSVGY